MTTGRIGLSRTLRVGDGSGVGIAVASAGRVGSSRLVRVWGALPPISDQVLVGTTFVYIPSTTSDWYPSWYSPFYWTPAGPPYLVTNANPPGGDNGAVIVDASTVPGWPVVNVYAQAGITSPFSGWPSCTAYLTVNGSVVASDTVTLGSVEYHGFILTWTGTVSAGDVIAVKYSPWPDPFSNASASVSIEVYY